MFLKEAEEKQVPSAVTVQETYNTFNMTSTASTTVKIVVSMVVVAALVATTFNSKVRSLR
jgi:hypothetical protein